MQSADLLHSIFCFSVYLAEVIKFAMFPYGLLPFPESFFKKSFCRIPLFIVNQRHARNHKENRNAEIKQRLDQICRDPNRTLRSIPEDIIIMYHHHAETGKHI